MAADLKHLSEDALRAQIAEMIAEGETRLMVQAQAIVQRACEDIAALRGLEGVDLLTEAVILQAREFTVQEPLPLDSQPYAELHFRDSNRVLSTSDFNNYRHHGVAPLPAGTYRLVVALVPVADAKAEKKKA
jgi:hypothetical protein